MLGRARDPPLTATRAGLKVRFWRRSIGRIDWRAGGPAVNATRAKTPSKVWYCPSCLRVVAKTEETCRHCGYRYAPSKLARNLPRVLVAAGIVWVLGVVILDW